MRIADLLPRLPGVTLHGAGTGSPDSVTLDSVTLSSQQVQAGSLFAALPGQHRHGLEFLDQALAAGASAVLSDQPRPPGVSVPWLLSQEPRRHTALASWALAGDPQARLQLIGITGTNGKSTVADLVHGMMVAAGVPAACLGTLSYRLPNETITAVRTTPEATELAQLFRRIVDAGGRAVVMEVSSHALVQQRVAGLSFSVAAWTNLTREHLDFHGDIEHYFAAKCRLFSDEYLAHGRRVLPIDDPWASRLLQEPRAGDLSWGLHQGQITASGISKDLQGSTFTLHLGEELSEQVHLPLVGEHNLLNALTAAATARAAGLPTEAIMTGLRTARPVNGRLERVPAALPYPVFVDYAHTPEGFRSVLSTLRQLSGRRLIVVFGAGGERDQGKREPMARAVGELADMAVITTDNPRSEDPRVICEVLADGVRDADGSCEVVLDRREAIARALELADEGCLLLLAGKGHEQCQIIGDQVLPWSDRDIVLELVGGAACG